MLAEIQPTAPSLPAGAHLLFDLEALRQRGEGDFATADEAYADYLARPPERRFDPSRFFSRELYRALHADVKEAQLDPLEHYLKHGRAEGRAPHPLFDPAYVARQAGAAAHRDDAYLAFLAGELDVPFHPLVDLAHVAQEVGLLGPYGVFVMVSAVDENLLFAPHPLFQPAYYRRQVATPVVANELIDYLLYHPSDGRPHPLFDPDFYVASLHHACEPVPLLDYLKHWTDWLADPSPFVDLKFLNHQLSGHNYDGQVDPLSFALARRLGIMGPLLHPHVDCRMIERAFANLIRDPSRPEAAIFAEVVDTCGQERHAADGEMVIRPLVSAIILNFHKPIYTMLAVLSTLNAFRGQTVEILMIENGGDLFHFEWMCRTLARFGAVRLLKMQQNRYFGEANNLGLDRVSGRYVLFQNNDCFLDPEFGETFAALAAEQPDQKVFGALMLYPDGRIQEFGGLVSDCGQVVQRGKGLPLDYLASHGAPEEVDYVSAACMLVARAAIDEVGGFDPAFEPFYYEDTDLCRRLRALGHRLIVTTRLKATHIENASTRELLAGDRFGQMIADHKALFARRWLREGGRGAYYATGRATAKPPVKLQRRAAVVERPTAVVYTPFDIRPGGGERYMLSAARVLSHTHRVVLCSDEPFSTVRVRFVMHALDIPDFPFEACAWSALRETVRDIDVWFAMGNEVVPPMPAAGRMNFYHLQFPFPWRKVNRFNFDLAASYDAIIVNSAYTREWTLRRLNEVGMTRPPPVEVVYPPVRAIAPPTTRKPEGALHLITVGRFFVGGHSKRQDIFLSIVERARAITGLRIKATIIGSVHYLPEAQAFYKDVAARAASLRDVDLIAEASNEEVVARLTEAHIYVHCAGFGIAKHIEPEAAEHFGISVVEALQAGCIPVVYDAGGPPEILRQAGVGVTYGSVEAAARAIERLADPAKRAAMVARLDQSWIARTLEPAFDHRLSQIFTAKLGPKAGRLASLAS